MQCKPSYLLLFMQLFSAATLYGQNAHRDLRSGDKAYRSGQFEKAENSYRQATQAQPNAQSRYNLGNALYEQKKYADAATEYEKAASSATDADTRARALHNLGNAHFQQKQLDKAIEAYKEALRNSPGDADTRRNLALAQQESGRQAAGDSGQSQPGTSGQSTEGSRQSQPGTGGQSAEGSRQSQPGTGGQSAEGSRQSQPGTGGQSAEGNRQSQPGTRNSKPETDKLLEIMAREEQKVQQRMRRTGSEPPKSAKDW